MRKLKSRFCFVRHLREKLGFSVKLTSPLNQRYTWWFNVHIMHYSRSLFYKKKEVKYLPLSKKAWLEFTELLVWEETVTILDPVQRVSEGLAQVAPVGVVEGWRRYHLQQAGLHLLGKTAHTQTQTHSVSTWMLLLAPYGWVSPHCFSASRITL